MKYLHLLLLLILVSINCSRKMTPDAVQDSQTGPMKSYESEWALIDSLEKEGLLRSALAQVHSLTGVLDQHNIAQKIKCALYQNKYLIQLEENSFENLLTRFESDIKQSSGIEKAVFESILGELYYLYLQRNQYRIQNRTPGYGEEDHSLFTWSPEEFIDRSNQLFISSIKSSIYKDSSLHILKDIILNYGEVDRNLSSSVYEFLVIRALRHYTHTHSLIGEPEESFHFNQEPAFADLETFLAAEFQPADSLSHTYQALILYQDLLTHYRQTGNPKAVLYFDLERLKFAWRYNTNENKERLYEERLKYSISHYSGQELEPLIHYELAYHYYTQGLRYGNDFDPLLKGKLKAAYNILNTVLQSQVDSTYIPQFNQLIQQIEASQLEVELEQVIVPGEPYLMYVQFRNVGNAYFKLIQLSEKLQTDIEAHNQEQLLKYLNNLSPVRSWNQDLTSYDYNFHAAELPVEGLPVGQYAILASDNPEFASEDAITSYNTFHVSRLSYEFTSGQNNSAIIVRDRETGYPVENALVETFLREYDPSARKSILKKIEEHRTDTEGIIQLVHRTSQNYQVKVSFGNDILDLEQFHYLSNRGQRQASHFSAIVFTDRNIYRPGQNIYFKLLVLRYDHKNFPTSFQSQSVQVRLFQANGEEYTVKELTTNEFGTAHSVFIAPSGGLAGNMRIEVQLPGTRVSKTVRVEEYKRPTFEVEIPEPSGSYQLDDSVQVVIKSNMYAGVPLKNGKVKYRVVRQSYFPFYPFRRTIFPPFPMEEKEIIHGTGLLDENGEMNLSFLLEPDHRIPKNSKPRFQFTIYADVVDITGETHSGSVSLTASYEPYLVDISLGESIVIDSHNIFQVSASNSAGNPVEVKGTIEWTKLREPEFLKREKYWGKRDTFPTTREEYEQQFPMEYFSEEDGIDEWEPDGLILHQEFEMNTDSLEVPENLVPGVYKIIVRTEDNIGNKAEIRQYVSIISFNENSFPLTRSFFSEVSDKSYQPGESVALSLGSPLTGQKIFVQVEKKGMITLKQWINPDSLNTLNIPVREEDRGNFYIHLNHTYQNRIYTHTHVVKVPWSNKELQVEWITFRDKTEPGAKEEWQIKITGPAGDVVTAEAILSMYDASLNQFDGPNEWETSIFPMNPSMIWTQIPGFHSVHLYRLSQYNPYVANEYKDPHILPILNWFKLDEIIGYYRGVIYMEDAMVVKNTSAPKIGESLEAESTGIREQSTGSEESEDFDQPQVETPSPDFANDQIRKNFNETAFFYPVLKTDDKGNIIFSFTIPDALTRWKLQGFSHTRDLMNVFFDKTVISQKEIMATPVAPRFLRQGDEIYFPVKVTNLTSSGQECQITLDILDANTNRPIPGFVSDTEVHTLTLSEGESLSTRWKMNVPDGYQGIIKYRVSVKAPQHTDIVEDILPVLTNRILVTETLPFDVKPGAIKKLEFNAMQTNQSETIDHHSYTLEYYGQPLWIVIQAMPYLMESETRNSDALFNRFYANALARKFVEANPRLEEVFRQWQKYDPDALLSSLQKNEDLKSALLEETPWLLDAKSEEEQKRRISLLFEMNTVERNIQNALQELKQMQLSNGGFPWFAGGRDNRYITQYILTGIGHMKALNVLDKYTQDNSFNNMIIQAIEYTDQRFLEEFEKQNKQEEEDISYPDLQYLYMRSYFPEYRNASISEAKANLIKKIKENWLKKSTMGQGMSILILHRENDPYAAEMLKSLSERALHHEELGIYWKQSPGYSLYDLSIETQALLIETYSELEAEKEWIDQMKLWLLKHKQTNRWPTGKATVEAIYAILRSPGEGRQTGGILDQPDNPEITIGGEPLKIPETEAGTGYFRKNWQGDQISSDLAEIEIKNPNRSLAWGAVYWQYFEEMDKIQQFEETPLQVKKSIFKQINTERGPELISLQDGQTLQVGDRIMIRLIITVDRDMDFVHLKDLRASGLEPVNVLSGYRWQGRLGYYESTGDLGTHFYFDQVSKGTHVLEYPLRVVHKGEFSGGISTIQCFYAPEFSSHSEGYRLVVQEDL